jgi:hypothetical protein
MTRRERLERRQARRLEWAASRDRKARAAFASASAIADNIPLGQPILVGHHSERHARRDQERIVSGMSRGVESSNMADHHRSKADGIERQLETSIFSDDPDAPERLRERIAALEAERVRMKTINAAVRAGPGWSSRIDPPLTDNEKHELESVARFQPYYCTPNGPVFPPYALQNIGGNIARLKKRLAHVDALATQRARVAEALAQETT